MKNRSNATDDMFSFIPELWTANLVISAILTVFSIYISAALIYHYVRVQRSKNEGFLMLSLEKKFSVISRCICIFIAVISVIRNINSIALLALEKVAVDNKTMLPTNVMQNACKVLPRVGISAVTLGTGLVYLFLWFRQRVFYIHPSINILNNRWVRGISMSIILVWFFYYIPSTLCYFTLVQYQFNEEGGCLVDNLTSRNYLFIIISWLIVSVIMQIALLGLFIFPIIKRTLWGNEEMSRHSMLLQRVKKAIIITIICLISDILSASVTWFLQRPNVTSLFVLYSLNLTINHLATVACFDNWKLMILPWNFKPNDKNRPYKSDATHSGTKDKTSLTNSRTVDNEEYTVKV